MSGAVHPGGLNAAQSLAFFHANGIKGALERVMRGGRELRVYRCLSVHLGGAVLPAEHKILALPGEHNKGE